MWLKEWKEETAPYGRIVLNRSGTFSYLRGSFAVERTASGKSRRGALIMRLEGELFPTQEYQLSCDTPQEHQLWDAACKVTSASLEYMREMNRDGDRRWDLHRLRCIAVTEYRDLWDRHYFPHLYDGSEDN